MKKRVLAICMSIILGMLTLAGCGGSPTSGAQDGQTTGNTSSETSPETNSNEIVEIIWQFPAISDMGDKFYAMEDALNVMMERDIGVHVTFEPTGLQESQNDATLMVSAGEQLDICLTAFTGVGNLVDSGLIYPLDELLESHGPDIIEHTSNLLRKCQYDGSIYGVPTGDKSFNSYGYSMKKQYAEKYDIMPESGKIYSLEEMEEIFDMIKAEEGDDFICMVPWNNTVEPLNYSLHEYDMPGGELSAGALMLNRSFEDTTIYNYFETEEYEEYCKMMYRWAQKGFISADAAVTSDAPDDITARNNVLGTFGYVAHTPELTEDKGWGAEVVDFIIVEGYVKGGTNAIMWNIPITSANPEKAMEALNYIYKNKEAAWLIQFGFQDEEWEIVEEDGQNILARYIEADAGNREYVNVYGIWGDTLDWLVFEPQPINGKELLREYDRSLPDSRKAPSIGYAFVTESVSAEIAAITTVIDQYAPSLNCGALDPDKALPEFQDALRAAGIEKVIEENQKQFDEFLSLQ